MNTSTFSDDSHEIYPSEKTIDTRSIRSNKKTSFHSHKTPQSEARREGDTDFNRNEDSFSAQNSSFSITPEKSSRLTKFFIVLFLVFSFCAFIFYTFYEENKIKWEKEQQIKINERIEAAFHRGYLKCQLEAFQAGVLKPIPESIVPNQVPQFRFLVPGETPQPPPKEVVEKLPIIEIR